MPLLRVIELLETNLGRTAVKSMLPMQPGDVPATFANIEDLSAAVSFRPATPIEVGVEKVPIMASDVLHCMSRADISVEFGL